MVSYTINVVPSKEKTHVLILVVVEDGLVHNKRCPIKREDPCLNPCCSGRWSRTVDATTGAITFEKVLILVVVEDGLVLMVQQST